MAAINFVRTPSNSAYGICPQGPCTEAVQLVTHFCRDCAEAEEALIAAINAIIKQKIGGMRSLPSDFAVAVWIIAGFCLDAAVLYRGNRRVVLEVAISAKMASYDQPRHPERRSTG
jgi:hypothetical protein